MALILTDDDLKRAIVWSGRDRFDVHGWTGLHSIHPGAALTWAFGLKTSTFEVPGCIDEGVALAAMRERMNAARVAKGLDPA